MSPVPQVIRRLAGAMLAAAIITAPIIANAAAEAALGATRTLHSLSAAQLTSLPDSTQVVFGGIPTTLGVLRANHQKLLARFAQAAAIGTKVAADVRARPVALAAATPAPGNAHQYVVVPPIANLAGGSGVPVPQDARDVCAALAATACLYFPANTYLQRFQLTPPAYVVEIDPLIASGECTAEGGRMTAVGEPVVGYTDSGCGFYYLAHFSGNFNPGNAAYGLPQFVNGCPGYQNTFDTKGAIALQMPTPGSFTTGTTAACWVEVYTIK